MSTPLLEIEELRITFATRRGPVEALRGVSMSLDAGQTLGIVGESGSGKSVTSYAVTHLLDRAGQITGGHVRFRGRDITRASRQDLRTLRGSEMSMIFQNPRGALNPIRPVGHQIVDALRAHSNLSRAEARERAIGLLRSVLIGDPERRLDAFPHELSGGMCQRIMIALAISCEPSLLIADEPTTGLDVTTQKVVMDLLSQIIAERGMAMILITHDLGLAAQYCGEIAVMEQGLVVERGPAADLFRAAQHPYTRRLIAASPTRTSVVDDLIGETPPCETRSVVVAPTTQTSPLLEVRNLRKIYGGIRAVDGVSLTLGAGESLGLVGESGSGKSTISRLICRLIDKSDGEIIFGGESIGDIPASEFHATRQRSQIQIVFQDPTDSLNPRFSAFDCIAHPLRQLARLDGAALRQRVTECAERSGLPLELLSRFPHQLSGGQKARVGIARAIATRPCLLVLDEPTAALDVSVQAVILKLLRDLRREDGMAFLFVSHDLNVVRMMCERTIVLRNGRVVEEGRSAELFTSPVAEYTRELLAAIPPFESTV